MHESYRDDDQVAVRPIRVLHGTADDKVGSKQARDYVRTFLKEVFALKWPARMVREIVGNTDVQLQPDSSFDCAEIRLFKQAHGSLSVIPPFQEELWIPFASFRSEEVSSPNPHQTPALSLWWHPVLNGAASSSFRASIKIGVGPVSKWKRINEKERLGRWASFAHTIDPAAIENARLSQSHAIIAHAGPAKRREQYTKPKSRAICPMPRRRTTLTARAHYSEWRSALGQRVKGAQACAWRRLGISRRFWGWFEYACDLFAWVPLGFN
jgi:hypothetical protein